jgi:ribosomal protein S18 acetylase RimI-like enzyme
MRVRLRELRDDELPAFLAAMHTFYAADLERNGGLTRDEAEEKATKDHAALFPEGRPLDGHHLYAIEDEHGEAIGRLWYSERDAGDVFLYAIELDESARGRGYGREAMQAFEELARERGTARIGLNVFGGNEVARSLYRSLGYAETSVHMLKRLV